MPSVLEMKKEDIPALWHVLWEAGLWLETLLKGGAVDDVQYKNLQDAVKYVDLAVFVLGGDERAILEWMTTRGLAKFLDIDEEQVAK